ncbi:hypothetical protein HispidOSU_002055, partial [Sigmodon hispidus]
MDVAVTKGLAASTYLSHSQRPFLGPSGASVALHDRPRSPQASASRTTDTQPQRGSRPCTRFRRHVDRKWLRKGLPGPQRGIATS